MVIVLQAEVDKGEIESRNNWLGLNWRTFIDRFIAKKDEEK